MTAPGGSFGEGNDSVPAPPWAGDQPLDQPVSGAPWASPSEHSVPEIADYPPTQDGPLPGYPPPLPYPGGYPAFPPSGYQAPGFQPPGYQPYGAPYPTPPPMPGPYGVAPGGYPGGYYPPSDYGAYGYGAMPTGMNTMAIVSLVSGIIGIFCCVSSIVGIVCGTIGLNQIKQTREDGYGLAIAGLVLSVATVLVYFVIMAVSAGQ